MRKSVAEDFPPAKRLYIGQKMPFGYDPVSEGSTELLPNWTVIERIDEALHAIDNGSSFREASVWLTEVTGRNVSHETIRKLWKRLNGSVPNNPKAKLLKQRARRNAPKTGPDRAKAKLKRQLGDRKRAATLAAQRLDRWEDRTSPDQTPEPELVEGDNEPGDIPVDAAPEPVPEPAKAKVIFRPNEGPQTEFLAASEREVLFGGAAGGGKSFALLADPMRYFGNRNFNGLILRRTNDELRELIWKSQDLYTKAYPGAVWKEKKSAWEFPSGAQLWFTYLERDEDVRRYQGQSFSYIAFDELTQHPTPFAFDYMRSRLRTTDPDLPIFIRATTNPGGPGHGWVKKMFIDPAPSNEKFVATDIETGAELRHALTYPPTHPKAGQPNPKGGQPLFMRRFIPASLYDNPYLASDGSYEANLLSLPENQRRQLLEGDWGVADGAAFSEFRPHYHTCAPFDIPTNWRRFRSCDYGYSSHSAVHWFAIDPAYETLFVYREMYVSKHTGKDLARAVLAAEEGERLDYGVLDSSCWHQRGQTGPSIAEEMLNTGCKWRPSDRTRGARVNGKNRFHEVLKVDPKTDRPGIVFFNTCRQIIADLPVIPADPKGTDDIDPRYASDHAYDSVRYGIMSRPRAFSPFENDLNNHARKWQPADTILGY